MPKGASIARGFDWWGPAFEAATNGRYKVEIYPGGTLVGTAAALDATKSGACEMNYTSAGTFPKQFPLSSVVGLPSMGFPQNTVKMNFTSNGAFQEIINSVPEVNSEYKDFTLLQTLVLAPYKLVSKKAVIKSVADFRGLKIGGNGGKMDIVTANGGAKVQEIPPDSYLNLDKGVTDATMVTWSQVYDYKLAEIANFYLDYTFGNAPAMILMNTNFYNAMGAADQKIMKDTLLQMAQKCAEASAEDTKKGMESITAKGKSIYVPTAAELAAWDAGCAPAIDYWKITCKQMGANDNVIDSVLAKWKVIQAKYMALGSAP